MISDTAERTKVLDSVNEVLSDNEAYHMGRVAIAGLLGLDPILSDLLFKTLLCVLVAEGKVILVKRDS